MVIFYSYVSLPEGKRNRARKHGSNGVFPNKASHPMNGGSACTKVAETA